MNRLIHVLTALGLSAGMLASAAAGTVTVTSADVKRFSDAGGTPWERESNVEELARHLRGLGERQLPAEQSLKIELLDVDLAGYVRHSVPQARDLRIARGGAAVPAIRLKYTLEAPGQQVLSGEETVTDMAYAQSSARAMHLSPLGFEKQMLERWFRERFVERRAAPQ